MKLNFILIHHVNLIHFFIKLCHKMLLAHKINGKYSILLYIDLIKSTDIFCNRTVKKTITRANTAEQRPEW